VRVEHTLDTAKVPSAGFEDREDHRIPFASAYLQHNRSRNVSGNCPSLASSSPQTSRYWKYRASLLALAALPQHHRALQWIDKFRRSSSLRILALKSARQRACTPVAVLVLHLIVLLLPGMALRSALSNVVVLIAVLLAAEACWKTGKRESDSTRYFWQLISAAFLFWAIGQTVWIVYENLLRVSVPTAGLTDVFYLGWAAPLLLALFVRSTASETPTIERALECAQIFVVLTITYVVVFSASPHASQMELDLNTLRVYNIQNAVLVSLFAFQAWTDRSSMRGPFARIAVFLGAYGGCISVWNYGSTFWGFSTGMKYDLFSSVPFLFAVVLADTWIPKVGVCEHNSESATKSLLVNFSPILIPLFPLFALLMGTRMGQRQYAVGLCAICLSFLLFAARLTLTHRRQAILLERLATSHERLRIISSATNDAVWDWDFATGSLWWGDGFFKLFGYTPEEISAETDWSKFLHPQDGERVTKSISEFVARGSQLWSEEYRFRRRDGTYAHVLARGHVMRNSAGAPLRMIGAIADVSDRHALAEQLRQAQKMEAVGQLAGGVAHDINNIIMVITSYLTLIEDHLPPSETTGKYIREVRKAAERGGSFTSQLLAFSRRQVLMPEMLNLNDYVVEQISLLQPLIGHHIALKFQPCATPSSIKFDRGQLGQVLMNLAINARDAMPQGGTLTLQTETVALDDAFVKQHAWARSGRYICLSVIDTGIGMTAETRARIFEPFFTTKEKGKGTGLGLATVYGIVKQSNALIDVQSELGKGTTFAIYIPAVDYGQSTYERTKETPELGGKESILLVEDEAGIRDAVMRYLTSLGYEVSVARNGEEGLELAEKRQFDMLVSDVVMPKMNGQELLQQFRRLHPDAPALLISGYTGRALGNQSSIPQGAGFMQKPFSLPHLTARIRELLDQRASISG